MPVPSSSPAKPVVDPAKVLTSSAKVPSLVISRMQWLSVSATKRVVPTAMTSCGKLKSAAVGVVVSRKPAVPEPAKVLTEPAGVILRMRWFMASATNTFPPESTDNP